MKYACIIVAGVLCLWPARLPDPKRVGSPVLKLTGEIENCAVERENDYVKITLHLKLHFTGAGDVPVLLLSKKPKLIARQALTEIPNENGQKTIFAIWTRPSIGKNEEWTKLANEIDKPFPVQTQINKLGVGDRIDLEVDDWFRVTKEQFLALEKSDERFLQLTYEMWPLDIEPRDSTLENKKFGNELRDRWKNFGYLWLDEIISQPIKFCTSNCKN